jgi:hypothetical protein
MNIISEYKYGKVIYNSNDYYMGTCISEYGEYCDSEIAILSRLINKDDVVLDIGSNIGLMTIPFSKMVGKNGKIIAYEPQPNIFKVLCGNVAINNLDNVEVFNLCVGDSNESLYLPNIDYKQQSNFGGISLVKNGDITVKQIRLDDINFDRLNLIKIDVEGMEINVLKGGKNTLTNKRPILYVENDRKNNSELLLNELFSNNYDCYWHISHLFRLNNHKNNIINVFDKNYICINVLALPREKNINVENFYLKKITSPKDWYE